MKRFFLFLLIIFTFSFPMYSESNYFSKEDLNIVLSAKLENKKTESCYIPYDYLNFYCEVDNEQTMKNNWLEI